MIRQKPVLGLLIILAVLTMVVLGQLLSALHLPAWVLVLVAFAEGAAFTFSLLHLGRSR